MDIAKLPKRHKHSIDDNMIPLINIVFLILIFFMVAGQIMQSEPVKVSLPNSVSEKHQHENPISIVVSASGEIAFNKVVVQQSSLRPLVAEQFVVAEDKEAFMVLLKVDGNLPVEKLRTVLTQIKQAGVKRVSLATQQLVE